MLEWIVPIFIFVAVIAIAALLFGGWLIVVTFTALMRLLLLPFRAKPASMSAGAIMPPRCANAKCRAENPDVASFCRRCGMPMRAAQRVPVRRVAMW